MRVIISAFCIGILILPAGFVFAEEISTTDVMFEAKVLEIIDQREITREDGSKAIQQDLKLEGQSGEWKNKEMVHKGISDIDVISSGVYKKGDRVLVNYIKNSEGEDEYYITDYVRRGYLYLLAILFVFVIIVIGRIKGLKALIGLMASFFVIMAFIMPRILSGQNPLWVSLIGSFVIVLVSIYITEGFNKKSHVALISIFFSLLSTLVLSIIFTELTRLRGMAQEETMYLINFSSIAIDFKGLLLAGILLGTLGVLDDGVISQVEAIGQIREANPALSNYQVFKAGLKVGNAHLGAIINTLFLTYAGASLPLLLLFKINKAVSYGQVINNEVIATEIVRTLVGSIGVAISLPIATFLAAYAIKKNQRGQKHD